MTIYHIAELADWYAAQGTGQWVLSTRGVTVAEQGFMHACSTAAQVQLVGGYVYSDLPEAVVFSLEETQLADYGFEVRLEPGDPTNPDSELFPHIYGGTYLPVQLMHPVTHDGGGLGYMTWAELTD